MLRNPLNRPFIHIGVFLTLCGLIGFSYFFPKTIDIVLWIEAIIFILWILFSLITTGKKK